MAKIRKRGNSYQIDYFDPTGKRIRMAFDKKKVAEAELGKRVSLIAENRYLDVKKDYKTRFKELLMKYEENFKYQPSFGNWKKFCIENFKDYFGKETLLSNIRYVDLETYRNKLKLKLTKHKTIRTDAAVNREMGVLRHIFRKAVEWEMMEESPFDRGKSLQLKENNMRLKFLTEEQIQSLIGECPKHLKRIVQCALNTGMRRGEILSLKWSQIQNGFIYLQKTKTNESRQIPINDELTEMFKDIRKEKEFKLEYVFTYAKGEHNLKGKEPVRKRKRIAPVAEAVANVTRAFKSALERAGIEDFKFHDLRHTFASHMVMRGASLKEVQEILGHKTMTMTLRYAHLSQEHKKKAVNLLNGLTASIKNPTCDQNGHKMVTFSNPSTSTTGQVLEITGRGERI
ncbi:tyrosine-type recombinase/integrase [Thermodesulfobacteriota bacterium]